MPQYDSTRHDPPAPVANVILRRSDNGQAVNDVALLIDTGADVSLLPSSVVEQLGLKPDSSEGHELIGFDGSRTIARAVELDLLFCNKAFRGRYLLTEDTEGILGRDILASLALLFDGPAQEWSERKMIS